MKHIPPNLGKRDGKSSTQIRAETAGDMWSLLPWHPSGIFPLQISKLSPCERHQGGTDRCLEGQVCQWGTSGWLVSWLVVMVVWLDGWMVGGLVCCLVVGFLYVVAVVSVPFAWQFFPQINWSSRWICATVSCHKNHSDPLEFCSVFFNQKPTTPQ